MESSVPGGDARKPVRLLGSYRTQGLMEAERNFGMFASAGGAARGAGDSAMSIGALRMPMAMGMARAVVAAAARSVALVRLTGSAMRLARMVSMRFLRFAPVIPE